MKHNRRMQYWLAASALGLALAASSSMAQIPVDIPLRPSGIQPGGDPGDVGIGNWGTYWISSNRLATFSAAFDPEMRSAPDIPGSIYMIYDWNGEEPGQDTDINGGATLPNGGGTWLGDPAITVIDATKYESLSFDIFWNVTNTTLTSWPSIGLMTPGYGMVNLTNNLPIPTTEGWQHLVLPIDPSLPNLSSIAGIMFYRWGNGPVHAEFWIDNVQLLARQVEVPPPALMLKKATPGFTMFADRTPGYNRQNLRTGTNANNNVTWVGRPGTVTYSMSVAEHPGASHPYFPLHITLVPGVEGSADPDWSAVNCVFLEIIRLHS